MKQQMMGWQWHQLDNMQIICTSLQTDNHTSTSSQSFTGRMLFLMPNQQCQTTEGKRMSIRMAQACVRVGVYVNDVVCVCVCWCS